MAWIEVHQALRDHRKVLALAEQLDMEEPHVVGHLTYLWLWALDNAPLGILPKSPRIIAHAAKWSKDPKVFVEAMVIAGFLQWKDEELYIHDWYDYAGKLVERRKSDAERKRAERTGNARVDDVQRTSCGHPTDVLRTVPNPTVPNPTVPPIAEPQNITPIATETASAAPSRKEIVKAVVTKPIEQLPKPRNPYWDAFVEIMGHDAEPSKTGAWGKAIHDIKLMEGTPDDIRMRAAIYPKRFPTRTEPLTPTALAGSWHKCDPDKFAASAPPPSAPRKFNRVGTAARASPDNRSASSQTDTTPRSA